MSQCTRACANSTSNPSACRPRDMTSCSARALVHCDNNPSRTGLNHLIMDDCTILSYADVITYPCPVSIVGFANLYFTNRKKKHRHYGLPVMKGIVSVINYIWWVSTSKKHPHERIHVGDLWMVILTHISGGLCQKQVSTLSRRVTRKYTYE